MKQEFKKLAKKNEELEAEVAGIKSNVSYVSIRCSLVLI